MYNVILKTPIGPLGLVYENAKLKGVQFLEQRIVPLPTAKLPTNVRKIANKIESYFQTPLCLKDLEVSLEGTAFQKKVWQALRQIPLGQTRTYGELANKLNTSARAIGMACRTNPLPLVVPCHRVVAANGIGGFCGFTQGNKISIKEWLLAHEVC
ncbi:MAG: methylated-DNA--[protein]-cysteine S-methyltransferase [Proteobacteria bacterium]|nr:methylated-DNA--[protein]-cysteine S-methyltransferase [Pseudomonadota bacterium]